MFSTHIFEGRKKIYDQNKKVKNKTEKEIKNIFSKMSILFGLKYVKKYFCCSEHTHKSQKYVFLFFLK